MILMAIKTKYAQMIYAGWKRYEYRKRFPINSGHSLILLYETAPVQMITGAFHTGTQERDDIDRIWADTKHVSGLHYTQYYAYWGRDKTGVKIYIDAVYPFKEPIPLSSTNAKGPPQSYQRIKTMEIHDKVDYSGPASDELRDEMRRLAIKIRTISPYLHKKLMTQSKDMYLLQREGEMAINYTCAHCGVSDYADGHQ